MGKPKQESAKQYTEYPDLQAMEFDRLVREYRSAHLAEEVCKKQKDKLKVEIEAALTVIGEKRVGVGELIAVQCNGRGASKIDKHLLVEKGVDPAIITACTVAGKSYTYVQVIARDEEGAGNEDRD